MKQQQKPGLDLEELLELIQMHGGTIVSSCMCDDCAAPMKIEMLAKLERMRELILMLPEHVEVEFEPEGRTVQ